MSDQEPMETMPAEAFDPDSEYLESPEKLLDYTQKVRKGLVNDLTRTGMPVDKDERHTLLQALRDMDGTTVNRLRLDVDRDVANNTREAQEIIKRLYQVNPQGLQEKPVEGRRVDVPDADIPKLDFSDDEKHVGLITENSVEFMARMKTTTPST